MLAGNIKQHKPIFSGQLNRRNCGYKHCEDEVIPDEPLGCKAGEGMGLDCMPLHRKAGKDRRQAIFSLLNNECPGHFFISKL